MVVKIGDEVLNVGEAADPPCSDIQFGLDETRKLLRVQRGLPLRRVEQTKHERIFQQPYEPAHGAVREVVDGLVELCPELNHLLLRYWHLDLRAFSVRRAALTGNHVAVWRRVRSKRYSDRSLSWWPTSIRK